MRKARTFALKRADAEADIALVNQFTLKELTPEDVLCFSVVLCDNEVDRDGEKFTADGLKALEKLMLGKTGIKDHNWANRNQCARLYRCQFKQTEEKNSLGETYCQLIGSAYILRTEENKSLIENVEGGIVKEVSIGFQITRLACSLCGETMTKKSWALPLMCKNKHEKGEVYEGKTCVGIMEAPTDGYEFSFVAVPSQRAAGTTKAYDSEGGECVFKLAMAVSPEEFASNPEALDELIKHLQTAKLSAKEREERQKVIKFAEKYR